MAKRLTASLGPGITLQPGYIVRVTAISPTTGTTVSGVTVSNVTMQAEAEGPAAAPVQLLPPLYAHTV